MTRTVSISAISRLTLTCCLFTDTWSPKDIDFVSARVMDVVKADDDFAVAKPYREYKLAVTFESPGTDLYRYAFHTSYNIGTDASHCVNGKYDPNKTLMGASDIFGLQGRVRYLPPAPPPPGIPIGPYHFYLSLSWREDCEPYGVVCVQAYNLVKKPQDACFVLHGGHFTGPAVRSNTVVVPKAAIEAALAASHIDFEKHYDPKWQTYG